MKSCIENFINGNLSDATQQAKRYRQPSLERALIGDYGFSMAAASAIAHYLKHPAQATFQAACDAQHDQPGESLTGGTGGSTGGV